MRIIIDTDPGIDDALAIILACRSPEIIIEALTIVCGNASTDHGVKNAFRILQECDSLNIPVYKGAESPLKREFVGAYDTHGIDGLGNVNSSCAISGHLEGESAVDFLIRAAKENPRCITLVPIGPLTNIALAVQKDPEFAQNIKEVVLMGGAESGGNCSPVAEFNIWDDPDAADIVFKAGFSNIVMVGLDVTRKIVLTPNLREVIRQYNTPIAQFIHSITRMYNDFHWHQERTLGCVINDPLTIAYLLNPEVLKLKESYVSVVVDGPAIGQTIVDVDGFWNNNISNCHVAYEVDVRVFFEIFFHRIFPKFTEDTNRVLNQEFPKNLSQELV